MRVMFFCFLFLDVPGSAVDALAPGAGRGEAFRLFRR